MSGTSTIRMPVELSPAIERLEGLEHLTGERAAVLARMVHAVADLAERCDPAVLRHAAGEASNDKVLMEILASAPSARGDAFAAAKARGGQMRRELLESDGGTLSAEEVGRLLGLTRQAVDKRRKAGRLLAVEEGGSWRYPAWQVHDGAILPHLEAVLDGFGPASAIERVQFFVRGVDALGGKRPLDLLRRGQRVKDVLRLAELYLSQSAP